MKNPGIVFVFVILIAAILSCGNHETLNVSNKNVYEMFSFYKHDQCEGNFEILWYSSDEKIVIGSVNNGKISFTLPEIIKSGFISDPEKIKGYDVTPGLEIAILDSNFRLLKETRKEGKQENHDEMAYVYANMDGEFKINGITLDLKQGWNLFNNKFKRINNVDSLYTKGYRYYAFEEIEYDWE